MLYILIDSMHTTKNSVSCHGISCEQLCSVTAVSNLYVLFCVFKMFKIIESPAPCEVQSVVSFFVSKKPVCGRHSPTDFWSLQSHCRA